MTATLFEPSSIVRSLASLAPSERKALLATFTRAELRYLRYTWALWARPDQLAPPGLDWRYWLQQKGRGNGKTRSAAEFVRDEVMAGRARRILLAGPSAPVCRDVMIEGESGLLQAHPAKDRPTYYPSKRRLVWPNGAYAIHYSSDEPDLARGAQGDLLWGEEVASWRHAIEFFEILDLALRLGDYPRGALTTTPKPTHLIRRLLEDAKKPGSKIRVSRGSLFDNAANLPAAYVAEMKRRYEGTRIGRQELYGELLEDVPGAVWTQALVEGAHFDPAKLPRRETWERIAIAIDPAVTNTETSSETGIMCGCLAPGPGDYPHAYILRDLSGRYPVQEWPKVAVRAYHALQADGIVGEVNNGGDLVESALRVVDSAVAFRKVTASRGKRKRAEPVVGLYEQGRVHHVGDFTALEEQMTQYIPENDDPFDRADSLVWLLTDLLVSRQEVGVG